MKCIAYNLPPIPDFGSYASYPSLYFEPAVSNYQNSYNDFINANQPIVPYQGIDNCGYEAENQYENIPSDSVMDAGSGRDASVDWNPINLSKLYPKLHLNPSGTYSCFPKNSDRSEREFEEDKINFDLIHNQKVIVNRTTQEPPKRDHWSSFVKPLSNDIRGTVKDSRNETDVPQPYTSSNNQYNDREKTMKSGLNKKWSEVYDAWKMKDDILNNQNITFLTLPSINGKSQHLPLPVRLVKKKSAQIKALQNLSKLKAMIHIAKEDRRTVQHKREEARRQFLSEVAEELQLMSSAKLAEIEASKSYRALTAAERSLADKDRDIHSLLEKEDSLYEDLTEAEASLAKADMSFIPHIKSEDELRQFASFLNFGF